MVWCEANHVCYVLGVARNPRLQRALSEAMHAARLAHQRTGKPARRFRDLRYQTRKSGACQRRRVGKAAYLPGKANPRFVVTCLLLREAHARRLYEPLYGARGDRESRIQAQQPGVFANRTRTQTLRAHQLRLYCSSFTCVLMQGLRRLGLTGTAHVKAQSTTIRVKLMKSGARIRSTVRKVWLSFSKARPDASDIAESLANLQHHPAWSPPG